MGKPKEGIQLSDGRLMIQHVIEPLMTVCRTILVVGECRGFHAGPNERIHHIVDRLPGRGPMSGLESLLSSGIADGYLVAACDQPLVTPQMYAKLYEHDPARPCCFVSNSGTESFPFPGYYPANLLGCVRDALESGRHSVRQLLKESDVACAALSATEESLVQSFNTPESLIYLNSIIARSLTGGSRCA